MAYTLHRERKQIITFKNQSVARIFTLLLVLKEVFVSKF